MKKLILSMIIMIFGNVYSQLNDGVYISNEYHYQQLWEDTVKSDTIFYGEYKFDVCERGIRIYHGNHIGRYFPWKYIGIFAGYPTYILSNSDKIVVYDDVDGIIWYSDSDSEMRWYRIADVYYNMNINEKK
jgi:hypothetical protein